MKKWFIAIVSLLICVSPCFAYSYCYKAANGHKICSQYYGNYGYNNYSYRRPMPMYGYRPVGGQTTVVNYGITGAPISVQQGAGPTIPYSVYKNNGYYTQNSVINRYPYNTGSGATFVFK